MKRLVKLSLLVAVFLASCLVGVLVDRFIVTPEGAALRSELEKRHLVGDEGPAGAPPEPIDFDLLDQVRPLDLIDMTLEFPEDLRALDGRRVRLVGFMAPYDSLNDMRRCMIVPSYVGCTFCAPPSLTQVVFVRQAERSGGRYPFIEPPSLVSGVLRLSGVGNGDGDGVQGRGEGHEPGFVYTIEDAVVTPYLESDRPVRAPGHSGRDALDPAAHLAMPSPHEEISFEALVAEVSELRELAPLRPIAFERVAPQQLVERTREEAKLAYPAEVRDSLAAAFELLGLLQDPYSFANFADEEEPGWIDWIAALGQTRRLAWVDPAGERIELLESASTADPFTRLELVKEIADALARQHFESARPPAMLHRDENRALEGLRQGNKQIAAYRYARQRNIPPASGPPQELFAGLPNPIRVPVLLDLWHWLPWETGPFFVEARTGATQGLARIDEIHREPPASTRELFRPVLYGAALVPSEQVPDEFADDLLPEAPALVERFGLGGLVPWLAGALPIDEAKSVAGRVLDDRYALWTLPVEGHILLLETLWPDAATAGRFRESVPSHPLQLLAQSDEAPFVVRVARAETEAGLARIATKLDPKP